MTVLKYRGTLATDAAHLSSSMASKASSSDAAAAWRSCCKCISVCTSGSSKETSTAGWKILTEVNTCCCLFAMTLANVAYNSVRLWRYVASASTLWRIEGCSAAITSAHVLSNCSSTI